MRINPAERFLIFVLRKYETMANDKNSAAKLHDVHISTPAARPPAPPPKPKPPAKMEPNLKGPPPQRASKFPPKTPSATASPRPNTLLADEDPDQYREVIDAFIENLRPADKAELRLVEKIGNLDWRIERLVMMETCILNMEVGIHADQIAVKFRNIDAIGFIVEAWKKSLSSIHCLDLVRRYLATLQHQFNTTVANFEKFEKRRLARKYDPDLQTPYQRPVFNALEADLEIERELFYPDPAAEPDEPEPTDPGRFGSPVIPIDVWDQLRAQGFCRKLNEPEKLNSGLPPTFPAGLPDTLESAAKQKDHESTPQASLTS